jgi:hypothetical protein
MYITSFVELVAYICMGINIIIEMIVSKLRRRPSSVILMTLSSALCFSFIFIKIPNECKNCSEKLQ